MSISAKPLIQAQYAPISASALYTAPINITTIIDKFTATNNDGGASHTLSVYLVSANQSAQGSNQIVNGLSIAANATTDLTSLQNQILGPGQSIQVVCDSATAVCISVSGRETS